MFAIIIDVAHIRWLTFLFRIFVVFFATVVTIHLLTQHKSTVCDPITHRCVHGTSLSPIKWENKCSLAICVVSFSIESLHQRIDQFAIHAPMLIISPNSKINYVKWKIFFSNSNYIFETRSRNLPVGSIKQKSYNDCLKLFLSNETIEKQFYKVLIDYSEIRVKF